MFSHINCIYRNSFKMVSELCDFITTFNIVLALRHLSIRFNYLFIKKTYVIMMPSWFYIKIRSQFQRRTNTWCGRSFVYRVYFSDMSSFSNFKWSKKTATSLSLYPWIARMLYSSNRWPFQSSCFFKHFCASETSICIVAKKQISTAFNQLTRANVFVNLKGSPMSKSVS